MRLRGGQKDVWISTYNTLTQPASSTDELSQGRSQGSGFLSIPQEKGQDQ